MDDFVFKKRVELLLQYLEINGELRREANLKFSDLDPDCEYDSLVYPWVDRAIFKYFKEFENECSLYKKIYSNGYKVVLNWINRHKNQLSFKMKVKLLMEYIENNKIPNAKESILFCDISNSNNKSNVGIFIQTQLQNKEERFCLECSKYSKEFPNAWMKMEKKINKRLNRLTDEERLLILMNNISKIKNLSRDLSLRFCDLDASVGDPILVSSWFISIRDRKLDWLVNEVNKYRDKNVDGYLFFDKCIKDYLNYKNIKPLSFEERLDLVMKYIDHNQIDNLDCKIRFCDLDSRVLDERIVYNWINNSLFDNMNKFLMVCNSYKDKYPKGYEWMQKRFHKYVKRMRFNFLDKEDKMRVLMAYIENENIPVGNGQLRFCDIVSCCDKSKIGIWINCNLSDNLEWFIEEFSKYRLIYPNAYIKMSNKINMSSRRIEKERILMLQVLRAYRSELVSNVEVLEKNLVKSKKM